MRGEQPGRPGLPFAMLGVDSDNDSAFMSQSAFDHCKGHGVEQTRSWAYKKKYASSRLYINFFQPSFKLKSKTRDGARVHKVYFTLATLAQHTRGAWLYRSFPAATKREVQTQ